MDFKLIGDMTGLFKVKVSYANETAYTGFRHNIEHGDDPTIAANNSKLVNLNHHEYGHNYLDLSINGLKERYMPQEKN